VLCDRFSAGRTQLCDATGDSVGRKTNSSLSPNLENAFMTLDWLSIVPPEVQVEPDDTAKVTCQLTYTQLIVTALCLPPV